MGKIIKRSFDQIKWNLLAIVIVVAALTALTSHFLQKDKENNIYAFALSDFQETDYGKYQPDGSIVCTQGDDYSTKSPVFTLRPGSYGLVIYYASDVDAGMLVQAANNCVFEIQLPATGGEVQTVTDMTNLFLPDGTDFRSVCFPADRGEDSFVSAYA